MPSKPTTRWQVSGYRFLVRRMEHALVRRDVRMLHDPMRSQSRSYIVGLVFGCLVLAGCGILALLKPQDKIGDSQILIGKESGAVYVVLGDTVHPVLNLASARLAAGGAPDAVVVKESELGTRPRGQLIGIPGAPTAVRYDSSGSGRTWTVCDEVGDEGLNRTAVVAGDVALDPDTSSTFGAAEALLVQGRQATYLVYDNKRARIDPMDSALTGPLGLLDPETAKEPTARPISSGLLNAIPEVLPIVQPAIPDVYELPENPVRDLRIGTVVQVENKPGKYWVVVREGLQPISPMVAQIIRSSIDLPHEKIRLREVEFTDVGEVKVLAVDHYPHQPLTLLSSEHHPVSCLRWQPTAAAADGADTALRAELSLIHGTGHDIPLPNDARLVSLAQADGGGDQVDAAYIAPGTGAFVQATGIDPKSIRKDSLFLITDTGVRYGIKDPKSRKALGLAEVPPEPAPWSIIRLLAPGPSLGQEEAMVAHDGIAPDQNPGKSIGDPATLSSGN